MTCKDCIHHDVCFDIGVLFLNYATGKNKENAETNCPLKNFKNKADYAEVKHGEWIEREDVYCDIYYTCSNCNADWTTIAGTPIENHMNYCPNCGAKMDGRREE